MNESLSLSTAALEESLASADITNRLNEANRAIEKVDDFIRRYSNLSDPQISTEDEILNYVFAEALQDLRAAVWNIASGHYKTAAGALRGALEMCVVALHFQTLENDEPGAGYNDNFSSWDRGASKTPNWSAPKTNLQARPSFIAFKEATGYDVVQLAHDYFHVLCSFTHSKPFDQTLNAHSNTISMLGSGPRYDAVVAARTFGLYFQTISWMVTLWLVAFPKMLKTSALGSPCNVADLESLLIGDEAAAGLAHGQQ